MSSNRALLITILAYFALQGWTYAELWADASLSLEATGGDTMKVVSTKEVDLAVSDNMVTQDYTADVEGSTVNELNLWSGSFYAEDVDDEFRLVQSELFQSIKLPDYCDVDARNEHSLIFFRPAIWPPELQTEMAISTLDGQRILTVKASMEGEVDRTIDKALSEIDQSWYDTYFADSTSKEMALAIGYKTSFAQTSGDVVCNWGHEYGASKTIVFD